MKCMEGSDPQLELRYIDNALYSYQDFLNDGNQDLWYNAEQNFRD